jgi:hypothetical protein
LAAPLSSRVPSPVGLPISAISTTSFEGRRGSWEAAKVREVLESTVGVDDEHRWFNFQLGLRPIPFTGHGDGVMAGLGPSVGRLRVRRAGLAPFAFEHRAVVAFTVDPFGVEFAVTIAPVVLAD